MNIGVVNVIHLLKKKEGRSKSKILTGDPVLNGMWKSKHHTWLLRHFSQVLDSLGKFGTRMIPTLTIRKWRYWQPYPSTSTYNWDGTSHLQFGGGVKRATACEHMKYRVLRACLAVVKLLVFNCAFLKRHRSCQPCCPTCVASQLLFLQLQAIPN